MYRSTDWEAVEDKIREVLEQLDSDPAGPTDIPATAQIVTDAIRRVIED